MDSIEHQPPIVESQPDRLVWHCIDESTTALLGARLARSPALAHAMLTLRGDLGAGKTTFVRHLLRALGVQGRIKSPTYAVVEPHEAPARPDWPSGLRIFHFDFYRFDEPREWEDAGLRELFADPGLKLVEWPDKAEGLLPRADLHITLTPMEDEQRQITLVAATPQGQQLLQAVRS